MTIEELEEYAAEIGAVIAQEDEPPAEIAVAQAIAVIGTEICRRLDELRSATTDVAIGVTAYR